MFVKWPIFIASYSYSIVKLWSIYKPLAICSRTSYWTWQAISCACGLIYSGDARVRTEDVILLLVPLKSAPHIFTNEQKRVAWSHVSSANTAILPPEDPEDRKEKFSSMEHWAFLRKIEEEKALAKVSGTATVGDHHALPKHQWPNHDPNNLLHFMELL